MEWTKNVSDLKNQLIATVADRMSTTVHKATSISEEYLGDLLGDRFQDTVLLRYFGLTKIPLLFLVSPRVLGVSGDGSAVRIPLNRMTRNHLGSMYFGTLAIGADCVVALLAMHFIKESGKEISLVFKDFRANFLKRAEDDVVFTCDQGGEVKKLVDEAIATGERVSGPISAHAQNATGAQEVVAEFVLTLSLKIKTAKH